MDGLFFFFSSMPAPGTGGGRVGGRGAGIDENKQKYFAGLDPKMTPNSQNDTPGGQFFFFRSQPSELAQTRRSGH